MQIFKRVFVTLLLLFICNTSLLAKEGIVIKFEDENLYDAIVDNLEDTISKDEDNLSITIDEDILLNIDSLDLNNKNISNLEGLESFVNLKNLELESNNIEDISILNSLVKLENLNLANNNITDVSFLFDLINLEEINLSGNLITSLEGIINDNQLVFKNLKSIDISSLGNLDSKEEVDALIKLYNENVLDLNYEELNEIVHEDENGIKYVTYEDFGAKGDGVNDDLIAIINAHTYANKYGYEVRSTSDKTYHIFNYDSKDVNIETNTNFSGAKFVIHDEEENEHIFILSNNDKISNDSKQIKGLEKFLEVLYQKGYIQVIDEESEKEIDDNNITLNSIAEAKFFIDEEETNEKEIITYKNVVMKIEENDSSIDKVTIYKDNEIIESKDVTDTYIYNFNKEGNYKIEINNEEENIFYDVSIIKKEIKVNIVLEKEKYAYTSNPIEPSITLVDEKGNLVDNSYYTISFDNNIYTGYAVINVKSVEGSNLIFESSSEFQIVPKGKIKNVRNTNEFDLQIENDLYEFIDFTKEDTDLIMEGKDINISINAKETIADDLIINNISSDEELVLCLDIVLLKNNNVITSVKNDVILSLELKGNYEEVFILREHDNQISKINTDIIDGKVTFKTDKFSKYAFIKKINNKVAYNDNIIKIDDAIKEENEIINEVVDKSIINDNIKFYSKSPETKDDLGIYLLLTFVSILSLSILIKNNY